MKYVPYLRQGGYVGIYIQDADNKTYLEPLALFILANSDLLGLTVSGIISATRYPMIIFQKVGANSIFPFVNSDRQQPGKKYHYHKGEIMAMYKRAYPAIFRLNSRLRHIYSKELMGSFKMGVKYDERDILTRAIFKWVLNLDVAKSVLVILGALDETQSEFGILANVCKGMNIKFSMIANYGDIPARPNLLLIKHAELRSQLEPFIKETKNELTVIQLNN
jgi:hypothetical protein